MVRILEVCPKSLINRSYADYKAAVTPFGMKYGYFPDNM